MSGFDDSELSQVCAALSAPSFKERFAQTLRRTYDQIYDGVNTGRYRPDQLRKTERTHLGSLVEINLQREFGFDDGVDLDFKIAGADVDCKWSKSYGGWMLPPEAKGHICLLITGSDEEGVWSIGLVRAVEQFLNSGVNRDGKKTLNTIGREAIRWLWKDERLPENVLLHSDPSIVEGIMSGLAGKRYGQKRVNELFRRFPNRIIGRGVVATVAQQYDYMKRVRTNGGARTHLKKEGIVIFGGYTSHTDIASRLGLPRLGPGDSMSARLVRIQTPTDFCVELGSFLYRLCREDEEPTKPAPELPEV